MNDFFQEIFKDVATAERFRERYPILAAKYQTVAEDLKLAITRSQEFVEEVRKTVSGE
jgi:hypothetical protein